MIPTRHFDFKGWRPKVLVTNNDVPHAGIELLEEHCDVTICQSTELGELLEKCKGVDGIFWSTWGAHNRLTAEVLDAAGPQLKSISTKSGGIDFVDLDELKRRNIPLGYTPFVNQESVAEMAVGLAIAASRRYREGRLRIDADRWEQRLQWMLGHELRDSTVGIVGFGGIGRTIAKRLSGFDVRQFVYSGRNVKPEAQAIGAKFVSFDELTAVSDFIFVSCPLTPETRQMFNRKVFARMKPTSVLINVARGDIIDQEALFEALKTKTIFAAGLDVTTPEPLPSNHPLLTLPNCTIVPHLGSETGKTRNDMAKAAAINVLAGLAGEEMLFSAY